MVSKILSLEKAMTTKIRHFIPSSESDFSTWANHFANVVSGEPSVYELSDEQISRLEGSLARWNTDFAASVTARDAAKAAVRRKDEARAELTQQLRSLAGIIQSNRSVSDAARDEAGLPIRKHGRTPIGPPRSTPAGMVFASGRAELTLVVSDTATPTRRSRPSGVSGYEVYVCFSEEAPENAADYRFLQFATRTSETLKFDDQHAGQTVHLLLRWMNPTGKPGPWSQPVSSIVPLV